MEDITTKEMLHDLSVKIEALSQRFDNELGSSKNPEADGSVKRHIRLMASDISDLKTTIIGDGREIPGVSGDLRTLKREFNVHVKQDTLAFTLIVSGMIAGLWRVFFS